MPGCPAAPARAPGQARASSGQDPCPVLLLLFLPPPAPTNLGIPGKGPSGPQLPPEPALSLCPAHPGSTHMWPPGRSSLVSIPSFSISICRKVLTFCRVSSSEYLWGTGKMRTAVLGLVSSPPARPPSPSPQPSVMWALSSLQRPVQGHTTTKILSAGEAQGLPVLHQLSQPIN